MNALHHKETRIMSYEDDFTNIDWVVDWADPSAKHAETDVVTFHGTADKVEIQCRRYPYGRYDNGTIFVESEGMAYMITVMEKDGKRQIAFGPKQGAGGIGGSWTANDTPPGPDHG
jgi:hypothetical protein